MPQSDTDKNNSIAASYPSGFKPKHFTEDELYQLVLPTFSGPLDLLLFLIRKHKVEISDIPVAEITQQYLVYLDLMKELDVEMASEFLVMATELLELKARMVLPVEQEDLEYEELGDPREELARRLREYERFKEAAQELEKKPVHGQQTFGAGISQLDGEAPQSAIFSELDPFQLIEALSGMLRKAEGSPVKVLEIQKINLRQRMEELLERLSDGLTRSFVDLFVLRSTKLQIITTFMSILELAKLRLLKLHQEQAKDEIFVVPMFDDVESARSTIYHSKEEYDE